MRQDLIGRKHFATAPNSKNIWSDEVGFTLMNVLTSELRPEWHLCRELDHLSRRISAMKSGYTYTQNPAYIWVGFDSVIFVFIVQMYNSNFSKHTLFCHNISIKNCFHTFWFLNRYCRVSGGGVSIKPPNLWAVTRHGPLTLHFTKCIRTNKLLKIKGRYQHWTYFN